MATIRINSLPPKVPVKTDVAAVDGPAGTGQSTMEQIVNAGRPLASQAEAEAGVEATKAMTPLTTAQAIAVLGATQFASAAQGATADSALQPSAIGTSVQAHNPLLDSVSALSLVAGDLLYATGPNAVARLPIGSNGFALISNGTLPEWSSSGAGGMLASVYDPNSVQSRVLFASNDLSDLTDADTALTNLGFGAAGKAIAADATGQDVLNYLHTQTSDVSYTRSGTGAVERTLAQVISEAPFNVRDYGAHPDNTDNTTAFANTKAAAIAAGDRSSIYIPSGQYRFSTGPAIDLTNEYGLTYFGEGTPANPVNNVMASNLIATNNAHSLVKLQGAGGLTFEKIHFTYADNVYVNDLVDLRQGVGAGLTGLISFERCRLGGHSINAKNANSLVRMGDTLDISINRCAFNSAAVAVRGGLIGEAVNGVIIDGCWFDGGYTVLPILAGGRDWYVANNTFEPRVSDTQALAIQTTDFGVIGLTYINNDHDDGATTGTWFNVSGGPILGGFFAGNYFRNGARSIALGTGSKDIAFIGNQFWCLESNPAIHPGNSTGITALSNYITTDSGANVPGLFTSPPAGTSFYDNRDGSGLKSVAPIAMSQRLRLAAATTGFASMNMLAGVAPTTPANGDMWSDGTNLFMRLGGVTRTVTMT